MRESHSRHEESGRRSFDGWTKAKPRTLRGVSCLGRSAIRPFALRQRRDASLRKTAPELQHDVHRDRISGLELWRTAKSEKR